MGEDNSLVNNFPMGKQSSDLLNNSPLGTRKWRCTVDKHVCPGLGQGPEYPCPSPGRIQSEPVFKPCPDMAFLLELASGFQISAKYTTNTGRIRA